MNKPTAFNKIIFERTRQDGKHLVCHIKDGIFGFTLDGEPVRRKTMVDFVTLDEALQRSYITKTDHKNLQKTGITGWWNNQVAMFAHEYELAKQAKKESVEYVLAMDEYRKKNTFTVFISTRGMGDYTSLEWIGDIHTPNDVILAECEVLHQNATDVDLPFNPEKLLAKIQETKDKFIKNRFETTQAVAKAKDEIANTPAHIVALADKCKGDPETLDDDIDNPHYWAVKNYLNALYIVNTYA